MAAGIALALANHTALREGQGHVVFAAVPVNLVFEAPAGVVAPVRRDFKTLKWPSDNTGYGGQNSRTAACGSGNGLVHGIPFKGM